MIPYPSVELYLGDGKPRASGDDPGPEGRMALAAP